MGRSERWKPKRLGEKLLRIRIALGLSQNEMVRQLGLSEVLYRTNISSYEIEGREPPLPVLLEYARVAGITMEILVDDGIDLPEPLPILRAREARSGRPAPKNKRTVKRKQRS